VDALEPVLDDLRENIEEAVQQQIEYILKMSEEELHRQVSQAVQPLRDEVTQQADQTVQDAKLERKHPPQTTLAEAIQRTMKALKNTMQWLARTLRALLRTVVELLKAVVNLARPRLRPPGVSSGDASRVARQGHDELSRMAASASLSQKRWVDTCTLPLQSCLPAFHGKPLPWGKARGRLERVPSA
jgi:hypothetical protein